MGNSASNPSNGGGRHLQHQRRNQSPSPSPGAPHRSMRTKKNSLQLPDLASLTVTQPSNPPKQPKTQSIPIPTSGAADPQRERGRVVPEPFSTTDLLETLPRGTNTTTNNTTNNNNTNTVPYYKSQAQAAAHHNRIQELYNASKVESDPAPSSSRKPAFKKEIVRSSIPVALQPKVRVLGGDGTLQTIATPKPDPVPVKIVWRGGGHNVLLARAGDDEWRGRRVMDMESPGSPIFQTTVLLPPGTHHIRFLVDDQWRVADDLPTAVDDQGSLANYVAVPIGLTRAKDPSFFAEGSSGAQAVTAAAVAATTTTTTTTTAAGTSSPHPAPPAPHRTGPNPAQQAQWTDILPPELLEAFKEEEMYLAANQGHMDHHHHGSQQQQQHHHTTRVSGFVPAPNIPPSPALPRHLDKLILNHRISPGAALASVGNVGPVGNAASVVPSGGGGAGGVGATTAGSGQGKGGRRDKTREERREERRRGRERGYSDVSAPSRRQPPPPPPPSAVGEIDAALVDGVEGGVAAAGAAATGTVEGSEVVAAATATTASTVTSPALPSTPLASGSATPVAPAATTPVLSGTSAAPPAAGVVASRALTIDPTNMPPLTDDASVLAVPSHVVLHHLCTSAIKNGVLAVATTTRYRQKYLTTVFYKPT